MGAGTLARAWSQRCSAGEAGAMSMLSFIVLSSLCHVTKHHYPFTMSAPKLQGTNQLTCSQGRTEQREEVTCLDLVVRKRREKRMRGPHSLSSELPQDDENLRRRQASVNGKCAQLDLADGRYANQRPRFPFREAFDFLNKERGT